MARKSYQSHAKLDRDRKKAEKAARKQARREERANPPPRPAGGDRPMEDGEAAAG